VEFWDVENFPGERGMVTYAAEVLPIAAQAAGARHDQVYPIDLVLAFQKLEEIKPHIAVWTTSGAASTENGLPYRYPCAS